MGKVDQRTNERDLEETLQPSLTSCLFSCLQCKNVGKLLGLVQASFNF